MHPGRDGATMMPGRAGRGEDVRGWIWLLFWVATGLKVLLVPTYVSTDFEVHRNWLAVTHTLPLREWYTDATSQWTLDYPPLFAWFERGVAAVLETFEPAMMDLAQGRGVTSSDQIPGFSLRWVALQRASVIVADLALLAGVLSAAGGDAAAPATRRGRRKAVAIAALVLLCPWLLLVDHVHFQYNGPLLGLMLGTVAAAARRRWTQVTLMFSVLLHLKHIFVYAAPVLGLLVLRNACFADDAPTRGGPRRPRFLPGAFLAHAGIAAAVTTVSLGPFAALGRLRNVLGRLFPFEERGLLHAYWAPNAWAAYAAVDKVAARILGRGAASAAFSGGLVGEGAGAFGVLPTVRPMSCLLLVLTAQAPLLLRIAQGRVARDMGSLGRAVAYANLCAFVFGWHVHEKALLMVWVPLALGALDGPTAAGRWLLFTAAASLGMGPLLYRPREYVLRVIVGTTAFCLSRMLLRAHVLGGAEGGGNGGHARDGARLLNPLGAVYVAGCLAVDCLAPLAGRLSGLPFLPLMLTSLYSSAGILAVFGLEALAYIAPLGAKDRAGDSPPSLDSERRA